MKDSENLAPCHIKRSEISQNPNRDSSFASQTKNDKFVDSSLSAKDQNDKVGVNFSSNSSGNSQNSLNSSENSKENSQILQNSNNAQDTHPQTPSAREGALPHAPNSSIP